MTLGQRIKDVRQQLGMNQEELAERCGISASTIRAIEQDRGNPTASYLLRIAGTLNVSIDWLLGMSPVKNYDVDVIRSSETIPLFSLSNFRISKLYNWKGEKDVDVLLRSGHENFAVRVENNSMFPDFSSGDIALVKIAESPDFDGQTCIISYDGQTLLRRFYAANGKIILKANNPEFKDIDITALDWKTKGKIVGVVIGRTNYRQFRNAVVHSMSIAILLNSHLSFMPLFGAFLLFICTPP